MAQSNPHSRPDNSFLGLFSDSAADLDPATVAVEFDTNLDPPLHDIDDNHVSVDAGAIFSTTAAPASAAGVDLKEGVPMTAWIDHQASRRTLRVWLVYSGSRAPCPLLVARVDLYALLREFMYIGFSASNGRGAPPFTSSGSENRARGRGRRRPGELPRDGPAGHGHRTKFGSQTGDQARAEPGLDENRRR